MPAPDCENARYSHKRNRVYCRAFNHAECRDLRAQGWSYPRLAEHFGVTVTSVRMACDPEFKAKHRAAAVRRTMSGVCVDCGKTGIAKKAPRCIDCAGKARRIEMHRYDNRHRLVEARCIACKQWRPADVFSPKQRESRHPTCRDCSREARQAYRDRHKVPCRGGCGTLVLPESEANTKRGPWTGLCVACWHAAVPLETRVENGRRSGAAKARRAA